MLRPNFHILPPQETPYSLEDILEQCNDPEVLDLYRESHRMALAMQQLHKAVKEALADPEKRAFLLPADEATACATFDKECQAPELLFDLTKERMRVTRNKEVSPQVSMLKERVNDPLWMARKHVLSIMEEYAEPVFGEPYDHEDRMDDMGTVTQIMMLMADNEVNHGGAKLGRTS